jgi:uncharacterized alpha-E superfamily protein
LQPLAVLEVLMADETNPRSLNFQMSHLVDLYRKLPRHSPDDLKAIEQAMAMLRGVNLETLDFPLPGSGRALANSEGQLELDRLLRFIQSLLPSWADNISLTYFNHARTLPISIGG